jgi:hypothetical protein
VFDRQDLRTAIAVDSNAGHIQAPTINAVANSMTTMVERAGERRVLQLWYPTHAQPAATAMSAIGVSQR